MESENKQFDIQIKKPGDNFKLIVCKLPESSVDKERFKKINEKNFKPSKLEEKKGGFKTTKIQIDDLEGKKQYIGDYKKEYLVVQPQQRGYQNYFQKQKQNQQKEEDLKQTQQIQMGAKYVMMFKKDNQISFIPIKDEWVLLQKFQNQENINDDQVELIHQKIHINIKGGQRNAKKKQGEGKTEQGKGENGEEQSISDDEVEDKITKKQKKKNDSESFFYDNIVSESENSEKSDEEEQDFEDMFSQKKKDKQKTKQENKKIIKKVDLKVEKDQKKTEKHNNILSDDEEEDELDYDNNDDEDEEQGQGETDLETFLNKK